MPDIVLATLNAKYIHASFGLRYLLANLGPLQCRARLLEFDINQRPVDIVEALLAQNPRIIGLGVYIWNVAPTTEVVAALKRIRPELIVILGGPEVSYETEHQEIVRLADHVITGEADLKFAEVCKHLLRHERAITQPASQPIHEPLLSRPAATLSSPSQGEEREGRGVVGVTETMLGPRRLVDAFSKGDGQDEELPKIITAGLPDFTRLTLPYEFYDAQDLAHRILYVEASRGCPFSCEFCLSSLDIPVRAVDLPAILGAMQQLLDRGAKQFKFVDRTFNLSVPTSRAILEFFLKRHQPGNFYHFEMIPDRLPEALREIIAKFPAGSLQFEVGIQTFNPEVAGLISRRQDYARLADNFHFLREHTGVHLHADLIVGLPGESVESFGAGFDQLIALRPQEIQVGILKRLRGTPIVRHDSEWHMVYNPHPPYEILQTKLIDFAMMQTLRRFARYWDLVGNSGNFVETTPLIWQGGASPFHSFLRWSNWLYARVRRTDAIALARLMESLFAYLTGETKLAPGLVAESMWRDHQRGGRHDPPEFLREFLTATGPTRARKRSAPLKRQARHLTAG